MRCRENVVAGLVAMARWLLLGAVLSMMVACGRSTGEIENWPMVRDCNLHQQACTAIRGSAAVTLDIQPKPIPVAKPLQIDVSLKGLSAKTVALDISGLNMYMGYNRVELKPTGQGRWTGQSMLAFCTNQKMEWRVSVVVTRPDGTQVVVPFYLVTRSSQS